MGADDADGHAHGPRASAKRPPAVPCDGAPGVHFSGKPIQPYMPGSGRPVAQQAPASYAIAGKVMFAAAGAFAAVLLALIALHLCSGGRRRRARDSRRRSLAIFGDEEAPPSPPRGLDPAVLRALPVVPAAVGAGDCAVCLAELERGEEARALPRCGHRFHVECIDAWFRENSTCPLCRADVEAPLDDAEVRIDVVGDDGDATTAKCGAPAMRRASSGMDLDKARRVFASTRSASF